MHANRKGTASAVPNAAAPDGRRPQHCAPTARAILAWGTAPGRRITADMRAVSPRYISSPSIRLRLFHRGKPLLTTLLLALTLPCLAQPAAPHEIHVLAAADLQPVLPALADQFQRESGIKVIASYGSSATLTTQILNGAPADLFLAADFSFPEQIVAAHLADAPEPVPYARGVLVLWARKDSPFQPLTQNTLRDAHFMSLAIANPDHAPYGRAAVAALTWMKLYDQLKPRIVQAENIAQTAQFVQSGNAQLGLISLTSATTPEMQQAGSFIRIPAQTYPEIRQCAVVILKSQHKADAHHFLDWLRSPAIQHTLPQHGLDPVQ